MQEKIWFVYMLECLDGSFYVGITNNLKKRMNTHKSGNGSKYVLSRGLSHLISSKKYFDKSEALKVEYQIKQLSRDRKLSFFNS